MDDRFPFASFPVLSSERFHLRQVQPSDAEAFYQIKSDPAVTCSYGREPHGSLEQTQSWLQSVIDAYTARDGIFWAITSKGEDAPIGSCCYWNLDLASNCGELGYELHRTAWGQGIMSEVLPIIIAFGFEAFGLNRIEATPFAENAKSNQVLVKLGFALEGTLRQRCLFRGAYQDLLYFGLLRSDWMKARSSSRPVRHS
jgi:[ribosomal protein S5]-alanine N-acetyltransferase